MSILRGLNMVFISLLDHKPGFYGHGLIFQVIIVIIFLLVIWWVLRQGKTNSFESNTILLTPNDILKRRLAEGEITIEEYKELKKEIDKKMDKK